MNKIEINICSECGRIFYRDFEIPSNKIHESDDKQSICRGKIDKVKFINADDINGRLLDCFNSDLERYSVIKLHKLMCDLAEK